VWSLNAAPGAEAVSKAERVNVRSRAGYAGEVMTQIKKGQSVTVLDTVTLRRPAADEPPVWLKIELPPGSTVWVNDEFVEASTGVVKADMLNLRSGPTYDHAIVHRVKRGFQLTVSEPAKDGWLKVSAPRGAAGYVPASLFALGSSAASSASNAVPEMASTAAVSKPATNAPPVAPGVQTASKSTSAEAVASPTPASTSSVPTARGNGVAAGSTSTSANNAWLEQFVRKTQGTAGGATNTNANANTSSVPVATTEADAVPEPAVTSSESNVDPTPPVRRSRRSSRKERDSSAVVETPGAGSTEDASVTTSATSVESKEPEIQPGRWVRREGILVWPKNIVAPSHYALKTRDGGRVINFVIITQPGVPSLREYRGRVVILSGREYLDKRPVWRNIPLLDVEAIEAVR